MNGLEDIILDSFEHAFYSKQYQQKIALKPDNVDSTYLDPLMVAPSAENMVSLFRDILGSDLIEEDSLSDDNSSYGYDEESSYDINCNAEKGPDRGYVDILANEYIVNTRKSILNKNSEIKDSRPYIDDKLAFWTERGKQKRLHDTRKNEDIPIELLLNDTYLLTPSILKSENTSKEIVYLTEAELCREILYAFTGVDSVIFFRKDKSESDDNKPFFVCNLGPYYLTHISPIVIDNILPWFINIMDSILEVRELLDESNFVNQEENINSNHIFYGLKKYFIDDIDQYSSKLINSLTDDISKALIDTQEKMMTLMELKSEILRLNILDRISFINRKILPFLEDKQDFHGLDVCNSLYLSLIKLRDNSEDNKKLFEFALQIFKIGSVEIFSLIQNWIDGKTFDTSNFFIKKGSVDNNNLENVLISHTLLGAYGIDPQLVPSFLTKETVTSILNMGIFAKLIKKRELFSTNEIDNFLERRHRRDIHEMLFENIFQSFNIEDETDDSTAKPIILKNADISSRSSCINVLSDLILKKCILDEKVESKPSKINSDDDQTIKSSFSYEFDRNLASIFSTEFKWILKAVNFYIFDELNLIMHLENIFMVYLMSSGEIIWPFLSGLFEDIHKSLNPSSTFHDDRAYAFSTASIFSKMAISSGVFYDTAIINNKFIYSVESISNREMDELLTRSYFYVSPNCVEYFKKNSANETVTSLIVEFEKRKSQYMTYKLRLSSQDKYKYLMEQSEIGDSIINAKLRSASGKIGVYLDSLRYKYNLPLQLRVIISEHHLEYYQLFFTALLQVQYISWSISRWSTSSSKLFSATEVRKSMLSLNDTGSSFAKSESIYISLLSCIYGCIPIPQMRRNIEEALKLNNIVSSELINNVSNTRALIIQLRSFLQSYVYDVKSYVFRDVFINMSSVFLNKIKLIKDDSMKNESDDVDTVNMINLHIRLLVSLVRSDVINSDTIIGSGITDLLTCCIALDEALSTFELSLSIKISLALEEEHIFMELIEKTISSFNENLKNIFVHCKEICEKIEIGIQKRQT